MTTGAGRPRRKRSSEELEAGERWRLDWKRLTGVAFDEETWRTFVHPEDVENVAVAIERAISSRTSFTEEYRLRAKAGHFRWVRGHVTVRSLLSGDYQVVGRIVPLQTDREHSCTSDRCYCDVLFGGLSTEE